MIELKVKPLYVLVQAVVGIEDSAGRLLREISREPAKIYYPWGEQTEALLLQFVGQAEEQLAKMAEGAPPVPTEKRDGQEAEGEAVGLPGAAERRRQGKAVEV